MSTNKVPSKKKSKKGPTASQFSYFSAQFPCETLMRDPLFHHSNMHRYEHAGSRIF